MLDLLQFHNAWKYLNNHWVFSRLEGTYSESYFKQCLDIEVVLLNPETNSIDDNKALNTQVKVWLEAGPYMPDRSTHDPDLDCGGETFEGAIIELSSLVRKKYGDDPETSTKIVEAQYGLITNFNI